MGIYHQEIEFLDEGETVKFGLSMEIWADVYDKAYIITNISKEIERYFKFKNYGNGIESLAIGIICIHPKAHSFFKPRKRYKKAKKLLEYDVLINYQQFKNADLLEAFKIIIKSIIESVEIIDSLNIAHFDTSEFRRDLEACFEGKRIVSFIN